MPRPARLEGISVKNTAAILGRLTTENANLRFTFSMHLRALHIEKFGEEFNKAFEEYVELRRVGFLEELPDEIRDSLKL